MFGLSGGRLTADMILRSPQYMNPCGEYEIDLRGNKIAAIENLGATENQFCSMDMSDNEIVKLGGFPLLPRLRSLYLNKNRIARIAANLEASVPNLETLVLTGNRIASWDEVRNLSGLKKLRRLVLLDNPLARQDPNAYRRRVLLALPQVKDLDFQKVKAKEREVLRNGMAGGDDVEMAAEDANGNGVATGHTAKRSDGHHPSESEEERIAKIKAALEKADTLEEIQRLEVALKTGGSV